MSDSATLFPLPARVQAVQAAVCEEPPPLLLFRPPKAATGTQRFLFRTPPPDCGARYLGGVRWQPSTAANEARRAGEIPPRSALLRPAPSARHSATATSVTSIGTRRRETYANTQDRVALLSQLCPACRSPHCCGSHSSSGGTARHSHPTSRSRAMQQSYAAVLQPNSVIASGRAKITMTGMDSRRRSRWEKKRRGGTRHRTGRSSRPPVCPPGEDRVGLGFQTFDYFPMFV